MLLLPLIGLLIVRVVPLQPDMAVGLMVLRQRFPWGASRLEKPMSRLAVGLLALIIGLLLLREGSKLPRLCHAGGNRRLPLNLLAMAAGLATGRMFKLPLAQQICVAIEVGLQNGTLAIAITAGLLNNAEMAIPAALYSLLMYGTGFAVVLYGRRATRAASLRTGSA